MISWFESEYQFIYCLFMFNFDDLAKQEYSYKKCKILKITTITQYSLLSSC